MDPRTILVVRLNARLNRLYDNAAMKRRHLVECLRVYRGKKKTPSPGSTTPSPGSGSANIDAALDYLEEILRERTRAQTQTQTPDGSPEFTPPQYLAPYRRPSPVLQREGPLVDRFAQRIEQLNLWMRDKKEKQIAADFKLLDDYLVIVSDDPDRIRKYARAVWSFVLDLPEPPKYKLKKALLYLSSVVAYQSTPAGQRDPKTWADWTLMYPDSPKYLNKARKFLEKRLNIRVVSRPATSMPAEIKDPAIARVIAESGGKTGVELAKEIYYQAKVSQVKAAEAAGVKISALRQAL